MANKISVLIDVATDKAVGGLKSFKSSITDADGAVGKFKAGASSAFDSIKANAGNLALVAGTALVTFGVKAVSAFTETAVSAGKFADATGLSTEAASRWVAVADDIGISGEAMEKSFGKLAVSIGKNNPLLEEYGITVKKSADGQLDMNATMLNAIDVINSIQDPTKKAAVAQAALGKGWMDMAELIEQGSGSLTESMAAVSEAQVIDPDEVEKAREMREKIDNLQDSLRDMSLVIGEDLVPAAAAVVDGLTAMAGPILKLNQLSKDVALTILGWTASLTGHKKEAIDPTIIGLGRMATALDSTTDSVSKATAVTDLMKLAVADQLAVTVQVPAAVDALKDAIDDERAAEEEAKQAAEEHTKALEDQIKATDELYSSKLALVGGDIAVRDSQRQAAEAVAALNLLVDEGKAGTDEFAVAQDGAAQSLLDSAQAAADYQIAQSEANGETLSGESKTNIYKLKLQELASTLAPGSPLRAMIEGYIADLAAIPSEIKTSFTISARGATVTPLGDTIGVGQRASGGPVRPGGTYLVGEEGPELLTMGAASGAITPNDQLGGAWGGSTINFYSSGPPTLADLSHAFAMLRLTR